MLARITESYYYCSVRSADLDPRGAAESGATGTEREPELGAPVGSFKRYS